MCLGKWICFISHISRIYFYRRLRILIACHQPLWKRYRDSKVTLDRWVDLQIDLSNHSMIVMIKQNSYLSFLFTKSRIKFILFVKRLAIPLTIYMYVRSCFLTKLGRSSLIRMRFSAETFPVLAKSRSLRSDFVKKCSIVSTSPAAGRREQDSGEE